MTNSPARASRPGRGALTRPATASGNSHGYLVYPPCIKTQHGALWKPMALFKSQLVTQASGSIGGATFTRTRSGMVLRGRAMPVNPASQYQQAVRSAQSGISTNWQAQLTDLQRESWENYASQVSRKNKLGDTIYLTGQQMFVRCNVPRVQAGLAPVLDGPTTFNLGDPTMNLNAVVELDVTNTILVDWTGSAEDADVLIYVSRPMATTRNFFKGPFRYNNAFSLSAGEATLNTDRLPQPIAEGNKVVIRTRVSYADGRLSDAVTFDMIAQGDVPGGTP